MYNTYITKSNKIILENSKSSIANQEGRNIEGRMRNRAHHMRHTASTPPTLFYYCRGISTNRPVFLQNKPNFREAQMNVSANMTKYYGKIPNTTLGENKPNSKPNKPNLQKGKNKPKPNCDKVLRRYLHLWSPEKQTQNKPNLLKAKK